MAISNFKNIENTKGYLVDDKDRKIFEREISKGYFGMNIGDVIEFVIYDSNDNILPQESNKGKYVRYIEYNDDSEKKYFGKVQKNKTTLKSNDSDEFFIDTEKLIREAGYRNGVFKTQISLLNRRLGSEDRENDKVWIHEIAPSRTEIRLLPTIDDKTGKPNSDLEERYNCFINEKTFYSDMSPFIDSFVEQFDVEKVIRDFLTLNGDVNSGQSYINLIKNEFKIESFDLLIQQIKERFIKSVNHYKQNRDSNILSNKYGQPLSNNIGICTDDNTVLNDIVNIIGNCVEYSLPKRDIRSENSLTIEQQETLDEVNRILKTVTSNSKYTSSIPPSVSAKRVGCKDPNAANYDPDAEIDDRGLCVYVEEVKEVVKPQPKPIPKPIPIIDYGERPKPQVVDVKPIPIPEPIPVPQPKVDPDFILNDSVDFTREVLSAEDGLDRTGLRERYDTGDFGPLGAILEDYVEPIRAYSPPAPPRPQPIITINPIVLNPISDTTTYSGRAIESGRGEPFGAILEFDRNESFGFSSIQNTEPITNKKLFNLR